VERPARIPRGPQPWDGFEAWLHAAAITVHVIVGNPDHVTHGIAAASIDGHPVEHARVELAGQGERLLEICLGNRATPCLIRPESVARTICATRAPRCMTCASETANDDGCRYDTCSSEDHDVQEDPVPGRLLR
jgi:hypothetical protein